MNFSIQEIKYSSFKLRHKGLRLVANANLLHVDVLFIRLEDAGQHLHKGRLTRAIPTQHDHALLLVELTGLDTQLKGSQRLCHGGILMENLLNL